MASWFAFLCAWVIILRVSVFLPVCGFKARHSPSGTPKRRALTAIPRRTATPTPPYTRPPGACSRATPHSAWTDSRFWGRGGCSGVRSKARRRMAQDCAVGHLPATTRRLPLGTRPKRWRLESWQGFNGFTGEATASGRGGGASVHDRVSLGYPAPRRTERSAPRAASKTTDTMTRGPHERHGVRMAGTVEPMRSVCSARPRLEQGRSCESCQGITYVLPEARALACAACVPPRRAEHSRVRPTTTRGASFPYAPWVIQSGHTVDGYGPRFSPARPAVQSSGRRVCCCWRSCSGDVAVGSVQQALR